MRTRKIIGIIISAFAFFLVAAFFARRYSARTPTPRADVPAVPRSAFIANSSSTPVTISSVALTESVSSTIFDVAPLPSRFNLAVPFTSQAPEKDWSQPWQDACEEAAVLMLDAYENGYDLDIPRVKEEILKMTAWEEAQGWGVSIEAEKVHRLIEWKREEGRRGNEKGRVRVIERPTVEQIKRFIASGRPVLVLAHGKSLPNPFFRNGGPEYHALVIRGYTEDSFITNDPGTWRGEGFTYRYADLMGAIHDWNEGDVKGGTPVALAVE